MRNFKKLDKLYSTANSIEAGKPFISDMLDEKEVKDYFKKRIEENGEDLFILYDCITNNGALCYVGTSDEIQEIAERLINEELDDEDCDETYDEISGGIYCNLYELKNNI